MENDDTVCLSTASPVGGGVAATSSGCHRNPLGSLAVVNEIWPRLLRAPPWTYAVLVGIGLAAAVILALR